MMAARWIGLIAACAMVAGCGKKDEAPPSPRPVLSMRVVPSDATDVAVAGTVEPRFKTEFGFRLLAA